MDFPAVNAIYTFLALFDYFKCIFHLLEYTIIFKKMKKKIYNRSLFEIHEDDTFYP